MNLGLGLNLDPNFKDTIVQIFKLLTVCFRQEIFFQVIDPHVIFFNKCTLCLLSTAQYFNCLIKQLALYFDVQFNKILALGACNWCFIITYVCQLNMFESKLDCLTN